MSRYVRLSPWAKQALTVDELAAIHARANALEAHVSAVTTTPMGGWSVAVTDRSIRVIRPDSRGSLAVALNVALDAFRAEKERIARALTEIGFPDGLAMVWCSFCAEPAILNRNGEGACATHAYELLGAVA